QWRFIPGTLPACLIPGASPSSPVTMVVNGRARDGLVEPRVTLADFLRDTCRLTGTHVGCEHGVCGACTALGGGAAGPACLMFAVQADGAEVSTVEGLPAKTSADIVSLITSAESVTR